VEPTAGVKVGLASATGIELKIGADADSLLLQSFRDGCARHLSHDFV
jgi:hypothetical protein